LRETEEGGLSSLQRLNEKIGGNPVMEASQAPVGAGVRRISAF